MSIKLTSLIKESKPASEEQLPSDLEWEGIAEEVDSHGPNWKECIVYGWSDSKQRFYSGYTQGDPDYDSAKDMVGNSGIEDIAEYTIEEFKREYPNIPVTGYGKSTNESKEFLGENKKVNLRSKFTKLANLTEAKEPLRERATPMALGSYDALIGLEFDDEGDRRALKEALNDVYGSQVNSGEIYWINDYIICIQGDKLGQEIEDYIDEVSASPNLENIEVTLFEKR